MTSSPNAILIKNGTLIDSTGGTPRANRRIVISGAKIAEICPDMRLDQGSGLADCDRTAF